MHVKIQMRCFMDNYDIGFKRLQYRLKRSQYRYIDNVLIHARYTSQEPQDVHAICKIWKIPNHRTIVFDHDPCAGIVRERDALSVRETCFYTPYDHLSVAYYFEEDDADNWDWSIVHLREEYLSRINFQRMMQRRFQLLPYE